MKYKNESTYYNYLKNINGNNINDIKGLLIEIPQHYILKLDSIDITKKHQFNKELSDGINEILHNNIQTEILYLEFNRLLNRLKVKYNIDIEKFIPNP